MEQVLLVVQVLVGVALVGIILIQRSETDGFGLGSGSGMNLLSGRGTANLLTRTTAILATLFIVNSLVLSIIAARMHAPSILDEIQQQESGSAPAVPTTDAGKPAVPAVPAKITSEKSQPPTVPASQ